MEMPAALTQLGERYELGALLGTDAGGPVYRAEDRLLHRQAAIKTIPEATDPQALRLIHQECALLAALSHPNLVEVYDIGEYEENGARRPFFAMPLLSGSTLDVLLRNPSAGLNLEAVIDIIAQACQGLQAAHDMGLLHRNITAASIFVTSDGGMKLIGFGSMRRGPLADQCAIAAVCLEALKQFRPPVPAAVSRTIQKAMAPQPGLRFPNVRAFAAELRRALPSAPAERSDLGDVRQRLEHAAAALASGDLEFAAELVAELERSGPPLPELVALRRRVDQSLREASIRHLLESARRFLDAREYGPAARKVDEALKIDPGSRDARELRDRVRESHLREEADEWIEVARQQARIGALAQARGALERVLRQRPNDIAALQLTAEISHRERRLARRREQKAALYESAVQAWERGDMVSALGRLSRLLGLEEANPDPAADRAHAWRNFYEKVTAEHDSLVSASTEVRRHMEAGAFTDALALLDRLLARYPQHAALAALKLEVETRRAPPADLVDLGRQRRGLLQSIAAKAQIYEERGQYTEAFAELGTLRSIDPSWPGIEREIERLGRARDDDARAGAARELTASVRECLDAGDYEYALEILRDNPAEVACEPTLAHLEEAAGSGRERARQAAACLECAAEHERANQPLEAIPALRQAYRLDPLNSAARSALCSILTQECRGRMEQDCGAAQALLSEALQIEPAYDPAQSLSREIAARERGAFVEWCAAQARNLQAGRDPKGASALVAAGLEIYPQDATLGGLRDQPAPPPAPVHMPVAEPAELLDTKTDFSLPSVSPPPAPRKFVVSPWLAAVLGAVGVALILWLGLWLIGRQ
jgi:hypothetical protein